MSNLEQLSVLAEVVDERTRQDAKWGADRRHSPAEWLMILGEEVGEANEAALTAHFSPLVNASLADYRAELVQVAAVAIAAIESLDLQVRETRAISQGAVRVD